MTFVILALATARLARLVTTDTILETPRNAILRRWPAHDTEFGDSEVTGGKLSTGVEVFRVDHAWMAVEPHRWSELLTCVWCASVWIGIAVWTAYSLYPVTEMLLVPFALSYVAGFLGSHE